MKHEKLNAWEKEEGMYHRDVIVVCCVMIVTGGDVGLLTWLCGVFDFLDPINLKVVRVVCLNNLLVTFPSTTSLYLQCL